METTLLVVLIILVCLSLIGMQRIAASVYDIQQSLEKSAKENQLEVLKKIQEVLDEYDNEPFYEGRAEGTLSDIKVLVEDFVMDDSHLIK